ncbi:hypothetical protein [Ligilactobacillus aviarius]|uniref:hypothetical protein n=1 Tax=Ligilactobacillus aviarius TaxID=1606 RepID=UPI0019575465|nr:hypothetical protein [Ligilactobacillus aviarius]MBM6863457.1 hypothetical protein [Ligilactobacillus aviarius]
MVFGLVLALIIAMIFMLCMAHSSHLRLAGKIIMIIALPFVGAIIGLLGDVALPNRLNGFRCCGCTAASLV